MKKTVKCRQDIARKLFFKMADKLENRQVDQKKFIVSYTTKLYTYYYSIYKSAFIQSHLETALG